MAYKIGVIKLCCLIKHNFRHFIHTNYCNKWSYRFSNGVIRFSMKKYINRYRTRPTCRNLNSTPSPLSYNAPFLPPNLNKTTLFWGELIGFFFLVLQQSSSHIFINGHQLSSIIQFSVYFTCTRKWWKTEWALPNLQSGIELCTCSFVKR